MKPLSKLVVYTSGTFDLFHIGHLRLLTAAKELGDILIVGVSTDDLVRDYKQATVIVPLSERIEIVSSLKCVDICVPQVSRDKYEAWEKLGFDVWVVGDDWFGDDYYMEMRARLDQVGVRTFFLPHTLGINSTLRRRLLIEGAHGSDAVD